MFKHFSKKDMTKTNKIKSSATKELKKKLSEQFGFISQEDETKKGIMLINCKNSISLFEIGNKIMFFSGSNGTLFPTLKALHSYPKMLPQIVVDDGAIKSIINGANVMCPGVSKEESSICKINDIVCIVGSKKKHAIAIGKLIVSLEETGSDKTGVAVEVIHWMGDDLWKES